MTSPASLHLPLPFIFDTPPPCEVAQVDDSECGSPAEYRVLSSCLEGHDSTFVACGDCLTAATTGPARCIVGGVDHPGMVVTAVEL